MRISERKRRMLELALAAVLIFTAVLSAADKSQAEAEAPELKRVEAATVDELLDAIAPNTEIILTGQSYNLTQAQGYGGAAGAFYRWNEIYDDGWELLISNVQNFSIHAEKPGTEIVTVPRYANVIKLDNCRDIALEGFTMGHTDGPGFCTGAVLGLDKCRNVTVTACDFYGCGTYGLELSGCRGVHVLNTTIRDCSYGALYALQSADVLLDGCAVYGIQCYEGIFSLSGCRDTAVINSVVRNCSGGRLVSLSTTRDFYLGGCEISDNILNAMFFCAPDPLTVEGCSFRQNVCTRGWYDDEWQTSERAVDPSGKTYEEKELAALTRVNVSWSAPEQQTAPVKAPEPSADGMIHVHTVDELLASIAPDTSIYLEDGLYNLSDAMDYGTDSGEYYSWMLCYDGPGLVIENVQNLTITAAGPHRAGIVAVPRYADVLGFDRCANITLRGFTAGHTQAQSDCAGGVLNFMGTEDVLVEDCSLYGCGVLGVSGYNSRNMSIRTTEIHHCSYGAISLEGCENVSIEQCNIHDIPVSPFQFYDSKNVTVDEKTVQG